MRNVWLKKTNPIVDFNDEDLIVWGQKTLERKPTALDRISVRRLMLYLQKQCMQTLKTLEDVLAIEATMELARKKLELTVGEIAKRAKLTDWKLEDKDNGFKLSIQPHRSVDYITLEFTIVEEEE